MNKTDFSKLNINIKKENVENNFYYLDYLYLEALQHGKVFLIMKRYVMIHHNMREE